MQTVTTRFMHLVMEEEGSVLSFRCGGISPPPRQPQMKRTLRRIPRRAPSEARDSKGLLSSNAETNTHTRGLIQQRPVRRAVAVAAALERRRGDCLFLQA